LGCPLQQRLEPVVGPGLEMGDEVEQTQFPRLLLPDGGAQGRTERGGQQEEQQAAIEGTERAVFCGRRERGQMQLTFPRLKDEFAWPA
jgi:hypothetical protein